ncbi:hypothetical protein MA16_Dca021906 [Dendrobium catenatum]|uniref:Uncharacterized protein n=1 Tax=Dendrobium catenatum TaxID=906689 RepID=A0A2I0WD33_9ASPA|nr:hypothetical protein MA16_Dca021906 [Dendrobium catenatum]
MNKNSVQPMNNIQADKAPNVESAPNCNHQEIVSENSLRNVCMSNSFEVLAEYINKVNDVILDAIP